MPWNMQPDRPVWTYSVTCATVQDMDSKEARDALIEFAQLYSLVQENLPGLNEDAVEKLVGLTRVLLTELVHRQPTEDEMDDIMPQ